MKAFLLAAGFGTRLKPLTDHTPKCLVEVAGKPLLEWWFMLMQRHGVHEFLINTHYLAEQVDEFVRATAPTYGLAFRIAYEPVLIGSAGTIRENWDFIEEDENVLVLYADNLTETDLSQLIRQHEANDAILTMALYHMDHPETRGIAELGADGRIIHFEEKPREPRSDLANGGIYVMNRRIGRYLEGSFDIGYDVLPKLTGQMYGVAFESYHRDIGTLESLAAANNEWTQRSRARERSA